MSTKPLRIRFTCADLPTEFWWRELRPEVTDEQLRNQVEEAYIYRRDDEIIMDESLSSLEVLGATAEQIQEQREQLESSIPVPKRIKSPVWKETAAAS